MTWDSDSETTHSVEKNIHEEEQTPKDMKITSANVMDQRKSIGDRLSTPEQASQKKTKKFRTTSVKKVWKSTVFPKLLNFEEGEHEEDAKKDLEDEESMIVKMVERKIHK